MRCSAWLIYWLQYKSMNTLTQVKPKIGKNVLGCIGLLGIVFSLCIVSIGYVIVQTGITTVPIFSRWYHAPQPMRFVKTQNLTSVELQSRVMTRVQSEILKGKPGPYRVQVTENELSSVLAIMVQTFTQKQSWQSKNVQVAVVQDGVEFFGNFESGALHADIKIFFQPVVEQGILRLNIKRMQIGDIRIPTNIAYRAIRFLFSVDLESWNMSLGKDVLREIRLRDGYIELMTGPSA